jgi:polysaccharide transporter, PST family
MNFGLNGFTEAVVQADEINRALVSNLFWINLGTGLLLTVGFAAAGSLLAWFYADPRVVSVTIGVSLTIFLTSISVLHLALLKRAMQFPVIAVNSIVARVVSVTVSIILGWMGWGYWALVAGVIALPLSISVGAWVLCRWVPSLPRRARGTASLVRYAISVYGHFSINYFARNMDNVLVGWRFGAQPLGFYKKAYDLFALSSGQLVTPVNDVAVATLSRLKDDFLRYRRYLLRAIAVIAFVGMGVGADLTLVGRDIIRLVLGPGWEEAGRIFVFFGPGIGVMLLYNIHGWIHLSIGTPNRWFRWGIIQFVVTALLFVAGLPWGPIGIAMVWTASYWILMIPAFWYAGKPIGFGAGAVLGAIWRYLAAALFACCLCIWFKWHFHSFVAVTGAEGALLRMVTFSVLFGVLYLGTVSALYCGFEPMDQVVKLLPDMLPFLRFLKPSPAAVPNVGLHGCGALNIAREEISKSVGR